MRAQPNGGATPSRINHRRRPFADPRSPLCAAVSRALPRPLPPPCNSPWHPRRAGTAFGGLAARSMHHSPMQDPHSLAFLRPTRFLPLLDRNMSASMGGWRHLQAARLLHAGNSCHFTYCGAAARLATVAGYSARACVQCAEHGTVSMLCSGGGAAAAQRRSPPRWPRAPCCCCCLCLCKCFQHVTSATTAAQATCARAPGTLRASRLPPSVACTACGRPGTPRSSAARQ